MGSSSSKLHHPTRTSRPRQHHLPGIGASVPPYGYGYPVIPSYNDYEWPEYENSYGQAPPYNASGFVPDPVIPSDYEVGFHQPGVPHIAAPIGGRNQMGVPGLAMGDVQRSSVRQGTRRSQRSSTKRRKSRKRTLTIRFSGADPAQASTRRNVNNPAVEVVLPDAEPVQVSTQRGIKSPAVQVTLSQATDEDEDDLFEPKHPPRAPTPFHPPRPMDPSSSLDSHSSQHRGPPSSDFPFVPVIPTRGRTSQTSSHSHTQPVPVQIRFGNQDTTHKGYAQWAAPVIPPTSTHFRKPTLPNPLPDPPVDLFASSPYRHLLTPRDLPPIGSSSTHGSFLKRVITTESKPRRKGGLFRAFSTNNQKNSGLHRSKTVEYVYVPTAQQMLQTPIVTIPISGQPQPLQSAPAGAAAWNYQRTGPAPPIPPPMPPPMPPGASGSRIHGTTAPVPDSTNSGIDDTGTQPIYFDQNTEYSCYLIHSPHRVCDKDGKEYPTAAHFLEALKFLPDHPEIAERVRLCDDIGEAQRLGKKFGKFERPSYALGIVEAMYDVIDTKIRQHPDLRFHLVGTWPAPLKYNDPSDSFWGIGPDGRGRNELGLILERIRDVVKTRR